MIVMEVGWVVFVSEQISHCPSASEVEPRALRPLKRGSRKEMVRGIIMLTITRVRFAKLV
jgi:hypothetical protein